MTIVTCQICENNFEAKRNDAMYCKNCKAEAKRRQAKKPDQVDRKRAYGRQYMQEKRSAGPQKCKEAYKQWYQRKGVEYHAQWRAGHPEWSEGARRRSRERQKSRPEEKKRNDALYYQRHKEAVNATNKAYAQKNREKLRPSKHATLIRYRARKANAEGDFTAKEFKELCEQVDYHCAYCHKRFVKLTADHILPLSRGGSNDISNIIPACGPCNYSKQAKTPLEYVSRFSIS